MQFIRFNAAAIGLIVYPKRRTNDGRKQTSKGIALLLLRRVSAIRSLSPWGRKHLKVSGLTQRLK
jgi:hypothetical protein